MDKIHIGFIMDGNGRWAKKRLQPRNAGHLAGLKAVRKVAKGALEANVSYLTLYCFSTENWKRPETEVNYLMELVANQLLKEIPYFDEHNVKILTLGDISKLNLKAQETLNKCKDITKDNNALTIQLAINYGGHDEICRAVNLAIKDGITEIKPSIIRSYFDNPEIPPVDLIVRSAGEYRLSNFLLFDSAYAELKFIDKYWPEFNEDDVIQLVSELKSRNRRFGGL